VIHLSVDNERTRLLGLDPFLRHVLDLELRYPTPQAETAERMGITMAQLPWADGEAGGWDGWVKLFHTPKTQPAWFPTGLLPHVLAHCAKYRYQVQVQDLREVPEGDIPEPREIPLRDYQAEAVEKAIEAGRGILDMPPRSGKTRTMTEIVRRLARPTLWVAPTDRIVRQTVATLEDLVGKNYAIHLIGAKNAAAAGLARVVVCTAATAAGLPDEFFSTRQVLVVDEWHHAAAPTYKRLFQRCPHVYFRFGMTGTHFRSGADALAMHALISRVIHRVSSEDLVALGHLVPSKAVFIPVGGPMLRGVPPDFQTGHGRHGIHEHALRQQMVAHAALMLVQAGRRPLVLVGTKRQGRMLKDILKALLPRAPKGAEFDVAEFVSTDMARDRQSRALASFDDGAEIKVLIGTTILGEGVDLPTTDALVLARGEQAEVSLVQALYRSATAVPGKRDALVVDFADRHHRKLLDHSKARLAVYWSEPTFEVDVLDHARDFPGWLDRVAGNRGFSVNGGEDRCSA